MCGGLAASSDLFVVTRSEEIGSGFVGILIVEVCEDVVCMGEVHSGGPLEFFVCPFITSPANVVEQFTGGPATKVVLRVQDFTYLVLDLAVDFDRFRRRGLTIGEAVGSRRFDLRDVEHGVDKAELVRKTKANGVLTDDVDDLEWTKVLFR